MKTKKYLSAILSAVFVLSNSYIGAATTKANDIAGHWAEETITKWQNAGLVSGYEDNSFKPNQFVTRAEFIRMLNQVTGRVATTDIDFSDVHEGDWYYHDISIAVAAGYTSGNLDGTFDPNGTVTRTEAAVYIAKAFKLSGGELTGFTDLDAIPKWARSAVASMVSGGYMKGYPDGTFGANTKLTRAEAVALLDRFKNSENSKTEQLQPNETEHANQTESAANKDKANTSNNNTNRDDDDDDDDSSTPIAQYNLSAWANLGRFESLAAYVDDEALSSIWNQAAGSEGAQMMGQMFGTTVNSGEELKEMFTDMVETPCNSGQFAQVKFLNDNKTIQFLDENGSVAEAHPYTFVEINNSIGMLTGEEAYVFHTDDEAGNLKYIAMLKPGFDEGMDEETMPAHFHFYFAADKKDLGIWKPESVSLKSWMPTMLQSGETFSTEDKIALLKCLFGLSEFVGGKGTVEEPYEIANASQLNNVRYYLEDNFVLTADINLSEYENWMPIGTINSETGEMETFKGTFDGNGHTISNLTSNQPSGIGVGLFGLSTGTVKNLIVDSAKVNGMFAAGGIIGYNMPQGTADNLTIKGETVISGTNCVGGIIGGNEEGIVRNCTADNVKVIIEGENTFEQDGPFVQCDIAECGGLIIGGGFTGTISGCKVNGGIVDASDAIQPVGLGGIAGCLVVMENISDCTVADVTIKAGNGAHAVGGLCGYAGIDQGIASISNCQVEGARMDVPQATHVGGLVGTGLYFNGVETKFEIDDGCKVEAVITGARNDSQYRPGAVAGRATDCQISEAVDYQVMSDGSQLAESVGLTERMYESSDMPDGFENLSTWANLSQGSFESLTAYINDEALSDIWEQAVNSEGAQMMAQMFGTTVNDVEELKQMFGEMTEMPGNNGPFTQIKFDYDYKTIEFCDENGNVVESHPYSFVEINTSLGMLAGEEVYVFQTDDEAGNLKYIAMLKPGFDEGMDEETMPAHFHFYYAADEGSLGIWKPESVSLSAWMPTMLQSGETFSTEDKIALLQCLFGIESMDENKIENANQDTVEKENVNQDTVESENTNQDAAEKTEEGKADKTDEIVDELENANGSIPEDQLAS